MHDEEVRDPERVRTPRDVVQIEVRDRSRHDRALPIEHGVVDERRGEPSHRRRFPRGARSGRRERVRLRDAPRRNSATRPWSPLFKTSGTSYPENVGGRVYWGYSSSPSHAGLNDSSLTDSAFPSTPG